ncbi:MAG TPA: molybdenum cofactor carrier protein [Gammaproteobacteria bacterium]
MSVIGNLTVGVMGSSQDEHVELAGPLGQLLADLEFNLLTGAGRGVMTSVSRAFLEARRGRGISIGVVPCASLDARRSPRAGSPNPYVELPVYTHLPLSGVDGQHDLSRNHINVLTSDVIIALPGSDGTRSEVELAVKYDRPVAVFAESAAQVAHFAGGIPRLFDIKDVEVFLADLMERHGGRLD